MIRYSGFADEAGDSIETQILATKELDWEYIESRNIDGVNLTDISDEKFEIVVNHLETAGVKVHCFGSSVANWSCDPRSENDFQRSLASLRRAIPRMKCLGTQYIRGMSFTIVRDMQPDNPDLEKVIFEKVNSLVHICEENGVTYLHENCMNYGGLSYYHTLRLLDAIPSKNFRLAFDTGNPVGSDFHHGDPPYHKQSAWEFYRNVREFIAHVHIKDCKFIEETGGLFPKLEHTFPGEGHGDLRQIIKDLLQTGYDGVFSIEPHLAVVYHDDSVQSPDEIRYRNYILYGKRLLQLVSELQCEV